MVEASSYYDLVPEDKQWKLDKTIDSLYDVSGRQTVHIGEIAMSMDEWEGNVADALGLDQVDVAEIKTKHNDELKLQTKMALYQWKQKNGFRATYRNLIDVFLRAGKTSYAEAVCKVLTLENHVETPELGSNCETEKKKSVLQENEAKIQGLFADLILCVCRVLKEKELDMEEFALFIRPLFPPEVVETIPGTLSSKITTIFLGISDKHLWTYSHYFPLKTIAKKFAEAETQQMIEQYERELTNFYATNKIAVYISTCQDKVNPAVPLDYNPEKYNREYFQKLSIKLDRPVTDETLKYVDDIWQAVAKFFLLPSLTALLDRIVEGSLIISWYIPRSFAALICEKSNEEDAQRFFRDHQIIEVMIDDECMYRCETTADVQMEEVSDSSAKSDLSKTPSPPPAKRPALAPSLSSSSTTSSLIPEELQLETSKTDVETSGNFTKRVLTHPELGTVPRSMPLIIPNDSSYDVSTNELKPIEGEQRTSLKIVPETLRLLETIERPIAVLAIGGPCRTGKSYILSRALGSADDFALGYSMNAQTFGIWIGTTVLEGEDFTVLMMDTEGIDSANAKARNDASILVMTVLLSSYFIYNSFGSPKKNDLQHMSHFAKLASSVAIQSASASEEDEDEAFEMKKYFPDFLWLLRDVVLQIPEGMTPTEYLKTTVLKRGRSFTESASDTVSRAILTFFPTIECMTIQPPSGNPEVIQDIVAKQTSLEPRFNEQVEDVVQYVLQNLQPKNGFAEGKLVDGPLLAAMTVQYIKAVNDPNAIPCINDTWQAAVEARCRKVLDEMVREYEDEMKNKIAEVGLPMEEDSHDDSSLCSLFGLHRSILLEKTQALMKQVGHFLGVPSQTASSTTALTLESLITELEHHTAVFEEKESIEIPIGSEFQSQKVIKKVVSGGILLKFAKDNHRQSRSQCQELFTQLYKEIEAKIQQEDLSYKFKDLENDLKALLEQYGKQAVGPAKWEVYEDKRAFIKSQEATYKHLQGWKKEKFATLQKLEEEKANAAKRDEEFRRVTEQMRNDSEMVQKKMEAMHDAHQREMEKIRDQQEKRIEAERQKSEDFMKAQMAQMANITKEKREEMENQHKAMMKQMEMMSQQNSKSIKAMTASVAAMNSAIQNMQPKESGGCFVAGTMVKLSDGKELPIEKQTAGVKILAMGGETSTITDEYVDHTLKPQHKIFGFNDDAPFAALHHPFWTTEGWKCLDPDTAKEENPDVDFKLLQVGDIVFRAVQTDPLLYEPVKVHRLNFTTLTEPTKIYGLHLEGPPSYHANGYIVAANYPVLTKKRVRDGMKKLTEEERESLKSTLTSVKRELTTVLGSWAEDALLDMGLTEDRS